VARENVLGTTAGKVVLGVGLVIGAVIVGVGFSSRGDLPENCRMVGKVQRCEEPSPTPSPSWWEARQPWDADSAG
jgi:hypothetical protein